MKKLILLCMISLFIAASAGAQVPQYMNYQGILRDSSGNLQDGTFSMVFKIYDAETSGNAVYNSAGTATNVTVSNGLYNVQLTANASIFDGGDRWLEIAVEGDTLSPRLKINSVAYAIRAEAADTATTATNANYATLSGTATIAGDADTVDGFSASSTPTADTLYPLDSDGKISGVPVSAEAASGFALFVDGRIGAAENICVGTDSIAAGQSSKTVSNTNVTANSRIILTVAATTYNFPNNRSIRVKTINAGTNFVVETLDNGAAHATQSMPFYYFIIN